MCSLDEAVCDLEQSVNAMRQEVWLQIPPLFQRRVLEVSVRCGFYSRYSLYSRLAHLYLTTQHDLVNNVHFHLSHHYFMQKVYVLSCLSVRTCTILQYQ